MNMNELSHEMRDRVVGELKSVIKDAENLLKNAGQETSEGFKAAKLKFESTLTNAKSELICLEEQMIEKAKDAMHTTDEYVKENPWKSVGLAAGIGVILGLLIGRR